MQSSLILISLEHMFAFYTRMYRNLLCL